MKKKWLSSGILVLALAMPTLTTKASASLELNFGENSPEGLSSQLKILIFLTFLSFLPSIVMTMTSFVRTVIVFSMLRSALGTNTAPPNQVLIGLTLFVTFFVMGPIIGEIKTESIDPYIAGQISEEVMLERAKEPLQTFMLQQTRQKDLELFLNLSEIEQVESTDDIPFHVVVPSFIISELKTAFEMSFLIFIPFIVIDFVVASLLMSMGMFMMPPATIALPFKLLLFVMVDGWNLLVESLVKGFM